MIKKGTLIRYKGHKAPLWEGKLLSVHEVAEGQIIVWHERKANGKWTKLRIPLADAEEVV